MVSGLEAAVRAALAGVREPATGRDIVSAGMVQGLTIRDGAVGFAIEVDPSRGPALEPLRASAEAAVRALPGVTQATVVLTAHSGQPSAPAPAAPRLCAATLRPVASAGRLQRWRLWRGAVVA